MTREARRLMNRQMKGPSEIYYSEWIHTYMNRNEPRIGSMSRMGDIVERH